MGDSLSLWNKSIDAELTCSQIMYLDLDDIILIRSRLKTLDDNIGMGYPNVLDFRQEQLYLSNLPL